MNYLRGLIITCVFCFTCFFSISAHAHYMWLNAHDYTPKTDAPAKFTIGWGHLFYNPVGDILQEKDLIEAIYMVGPGNEKIHIAPMNAFQYQSEKDLAKGSYVAAVKRKEGFSTKTTDGYKRQSKKGLKNVITSRYLGMYGKAIINVGHSDKGDCVVHPVGDTLEIVPMVNPATLSSGSYFKFKLLYQGKPLAEYIKATYVGFSSDDVWAYNTRTGKDGIGEIKILKSGIWILKGSHKAPYPDPEDADEYSYTTSLSFEVR